MANMHVRGTQGLTTEIVCHFPIANATNLVGTTYRAAYGRSLHPLIQESLLPDGDGTDGTISAAEKAEVEVAEPSVAEVVIRFSYPSDWGQLTGAQQNQRLDEWYAAQLDDFQERNIARFQYYGHTR